MLSRKLICFIWNGWGSNKKMTSYTENKTLVPGTLVPGTLGPVVLGPGALEKRYVESLDELDRIALNVARSTLGSLFSLEKSNHYMEWKSANKGPQPA
jgi:hypothetical protein